jgi:hypothetical protein
MMKSISFLILWLTVTTGALCQDISEAPVTSPSALDQGESEAQEGDTDSLEAITFNGGFHTEYYNAVQTDSSGTLRKLQFAPTVGAGLSYPLSPSWRFLPEMNWVLPRFIDDSRIIKNVFMIRADLGYDVFEWLRLRVGTSLMWLNQHGRGGKAEMNNGNDKSTFYYPSENRSSLNNTLDIGAEVKNGDWSLRLQTYTYALFKEERRQLSYTLFVTYYWKQ